MRTSYLKLTSTLFTFLLISSISAQELRSIPDQLPKKELADLNEHQYQVTTDYITFSILGSILLFSSE